MWDVERERWVSPPLDRRTAALKCNSGRQRPAVTAALAAPKSRLVCGEIRDFGQTVGTRCFHCAETVLVTIGCLRRAACAEPEAAVVGIGFVPVFGAVNFSRGRSWHGVLLVGWMA